ncbi:AAA ATPase [Croceitalea dokdonensis DOKDO 023]|uniref:AAA ATPase n=1 Tax=Croceitalea dokdonensis DOKDO 023 TaxID=1300341 RepID=A0A0N8H3Z0_9FLAO|nr:AAA family ATPase [Croceitalea dokdonensis]KPM31908.1 AAA ATPase [Croceitalea dokdonensis DOKDO 023]
MQELFAHQESLIAHAPPNERYLAKEIDWSDRLIAIKGARGSGKTSLLLQRAKFHLVDKAYLYTTLDSLYFLENTLVSLADEFVLQGGEYLLLDEVHKYPRWSREIKLIYDKHPKLHLVFTSSSMLEVYKGESDLSRRVVTYHLKELSFREFLYLDKGHKISKVSMADILTGHKDIARAFLKDINHPIKVFKEYLQYGAYPYFLENKESYGERLLQTINLIIESDMAAVENITYDDSRKIKKLLIAISQSAPFTPNIKKLSERLGINRTFLINAIKLLDRADLIISLFKPDKGIGQFTKPEKLYLNNTNIVNALGKGNAEIGTVRETFFANQFKHLKNCEIHLAEKADFIIDRKFTFEIGGKGKSSKQIKNVANSYVVRDDMEVGALNIIPLYLFGLMY